MSPPAQSGRNEWPISTRKVVPLAAARMAQRAVPAKNRAWMRPPSSGHFTFGATILD